MSSSNCCLLTCIQISQEVGKVVWCSHLLKNFPVCCDPHKGFNIVNEQKVIFFWNPLAFSMVQRMLAIWSLVSLPFLNPACTSGSSQLMNCWSLAWRIWAWPCWLVKWVQLWGSLNILWHCLSLGLEWKLTFSSPVVTAGFSKFADLLSAALKRHHLLGFEIAQLEFHHFH